MGTNKDGRIVARGLALAFFIVNTIGSPTFVAPNRNQSLRKFAANAARLQRGRYLVEGPTHCFHCHSESIPTRSKLAIKPKKEGGGAPFPLKLPFRVICPNISSDRETGAGTWTDEELERAIVQGIGHDGRVLYGMPYQNLSHLSDEDLASVIVYVRSIPPVHNALPRTELPIAVAEKLRPLSPRISRLPTPDASDLLKRGSYLVTIGNCRACHTPLDLDGKPIKTLDFSGGRLFMGAWGSVASANLTQDPSGIRYYDELLFIRVMRTGRVGARKIKNIMPWNSFRNMTDEDLKAIFAYLRKIPSVRHRVDNTKPLTYCKICRQIHGGGELN